MADLTLTHTDNFDDSDEGVFEQGDGSPPGSQADEDTLPPLLKIQKYAQSENIHERQTVWRILVDLFKNAQPDVMTTYLHLIMTVVVKLADEGEKAVRQELLEQVPHIAQVSRECSSRIPALSGVLLEYLLPMVLRNLGTEENLVRRTAQTSLFELIDKDYLTKGDIEAHVCPVVLELSNNSANDYHIGAITLMSKLAPKLGREVTERVFLDRFTDLCMNQTFYVRKVCAANLGEFCSVVGREAYERRLLPSYMRLCADEIWGVRKACADVAMSVSCACPPLERRAILAPAFIKLLQDGSRWVRMSAFQTLGPFISTFADPAISSLFYNNVGELMSVNSDGREFRVNSTPQRNYQLDNCNPSIDETFMDLLLTSSSKDRIEWIGEGQSHDAPPPPPPAEDNTSDVTIDIPIVEDEEIETVEVSEMEKKREEVIIQKSFNIVSKAMYGEVVVDKTTPEDNLEDLGAPKEEQEDIKEIVETVKNAVLSFRNPHDQNCDIDMSEGNCRNVAESSANLLEICRRNKGTKDGGGDGTEIIEKLDDGKELKSKDDGLDQFNSYNYWYISPEMPVDLGAVEEGPKVEEEVVLDTPQRDRINDLFLNMALDDSCGEENNQHLLRLNEESAYEEGASRTEPHSRKMLVGDSPHGVPQYLIEHFISMTDPLLAQNTDDEMAFHCAYSLPAVALTLGSRNWHMLKDTVEVLASDMQYKVRRTVASSLHELALILGTEIATNYLTPIFDGFIKDLDEVRIGVLKHLAHFLKLISPTKRAMYLPRLADFLQADNELNWRFRQELAEQLRMAVPLFRPADAAKHLFYIGSSLLTDKVSAVRETSFALVCDLLRYVSGDHDLTHRLLIMLAERFAHSKMWKRRQTFVLLCAELLTADSIPLDVFASDVMPHLLDLSWDPVANVRLVVARTITKHMVMHSYFADPANQHYEGLETVIRRLQADKDRDVRHCAIIDSYTSTTAVH